MATNTKHCRYCDLTLSLDEFGNSRKNKDGKQTKCKICAQLYVYQNNARGKGLPYMTAAEWRGLCATYEHKCAACGERKPLTVDHVQPLILLNYRGGFDISNVQPLCQRCNSKKQRRHIDYRKTVYDR